MQAAYNDDTPSPEQSRLPRPTPNQQSSIIMQAAPPHNPPLLVGMPPPFPYFSLQHPHDPPIHSFYHPMTPANNNAQIFSQPWSTGLFDCFSDLKNSFITCFCPCITFGQVDEILSEGQMAWWESALMFGLLETLSFSQASFVFEWYHRVQFRKKYNLMGNLLSELVITLFCTRLVLCQNYRQLNRLGFDVALGWNANKKKRKRITSDAAVQCVPPAVNPRMFR